MNSSRAGGEKEVMEMGDWTVRWTSPSASSDSRSLRLEGKTKGGAMEGEKEIFFSRILIL